MPKASASRTFSLKLMNNSMYSSRASTVYTLSRLFLPNTCSKSANDTRSPAMSSTSVSWANTVAVTRVNAVARPVRRGKNVEVFMVFKIRFNVGCSWGLLG